jgi:hypothetical protein
MLSTIIFIITRGWHNRPGVAAVPIASQLKKKKHSQLSGINGMCKTLCDNKIGEILRN